MKAKLYYQCFFGVRVQYSHAYSVEWFYLFDWTVWSFLALIAAQYLIILAVDEVQIKSILSMAAVQNWVNLNCERIGY